MSTPKPQLISFKLCPFVQRSVITLLEKDVDFDIEFIDLANKPDWFLEISPLGKVPTLKIGKEVLFESAVINEYLDETNPPSLHPQDALTKAKHRAWTEYGSQLLLNHYKLTHAEDEDTFNDAVQSVQEVLGKIEKVVDETGPFFGGADFQLVDTGYAPAFHRFALMKEMTGFDVMEGAEVPKIRRWSEALLARKSVQKSVVDDFDTLYKEYLEKNATYLMRNAKAA